MKRLSRDVLRYTTSLLFGFTALILLVSVPRAVDAAGAKQVVITEIAWMGTAVSTSDEWIELYNNTANAVDLTGWTLQSQDGTPSITLSGTVPAHGHFLLERTDDTSIPNIAADLIYTGALGNTGEALVLTDAAAVVQDQTNATWDAGDNTTKATMERIDTLADGTDAANWINGSVAYGSGLGLGTPQNSAATPAPPGEAFIYDLKFAGGLSAATVIDSNSHPSTESTLPMAQAVLARINAATTSIDFAVYGFRNQCAFKDALIAAQARGVTVRGFVDQESDGTYTYTDANGCDTQAMIDALGDDGAGNPWVRFDRNPSTGKGYGYIMHNKFLMIDGRWVSTGSTNYSDSGIGGEYNANWNILIESVNLANVYAAEFNEMWVSGLSHHTKTDNTLHVLPAYTDGTVVESYFSPSDDAMNHAIIPAINGANTSLDIAIFYLTSQDIADAILAAKSHGAAVRVILDSTGAGNTYSKHGQLCAAGIPVKIENWNGKMHMKAMMADANSMIIGSQNFTGAANDDNDENTLWIRGGAVGTISANYQTYYDSLWNSIPAQFSCVNPGAESLNTGNTCSDGIDNDFDGFIDGADSGCQ